MTTTEGNKLIAEFMGVSHAAGDNGLFYYVNGDSYDSLEYHTSWDWLMPVVEKINSICTTQLNNYSNDHSFVILLPDGKYWDNCPQGGKPDRIWVKSNTMKDAVYKTVIQFINWYNQNKQP